MIDAYKHQLPDFKYAPASIFTQQNPLSATTNMPIAYFSSLRAEKKNEVLKSQLLGVSNKAFQDDATNRMRDRLHTGFDRHMNIINGRKKAKIALQTSELICKAMNDGM